MAAPGWAPRRAAAGRPAAVDRGARMIRGLPARRASRPRTWGRWRPAAARAGGSVAPFASALTHFLIGLVPVCFDRARDSAWARGAVRSSSMSTENGCATEHAPREPFLERLTASRRCRAWRRRLCRAPTINRLILSVASLLRERAAPRASFCVTGLSFEAP